MRSLLLRWLMSLTDFKIHSVLVIGICVITIALPRADCSEIDAYSGLARESGPARTLGKLGGLDGLSPGV